MTSVIYYKLKNAIQQHSVSFDGSVIQIGDVKHLVANKEGLGPEGAAELTLFDSNTGDEFTDDGKVITRNTLVIVKRAPAAKFKPLVATIEQQLPKTGAGEQPATDILNTASNTKHQDGNADFGGDFYTDQPVAAVIDEDESKALQELLQGTAVNWQREVRQGVMRGRGRGRGRGSVAFDYRCPRCDAVGAHWLQDCPTQGDPAYDRKRIRPPVGIPMTRLARSTEGGLVLPDGQTGTLIANEDSFAREILGLGLLPETALAGDAGATTAAPSMPPPPTAKPLPPPGSPLLVLDNKPFQVTQEQQQPPSAPPSALGPAPILAGDLDNGPPLAGSAMPGASFFDVYKRAALLPRGPPQFIERAYNGNKPLRRSEFERMQDDYRRRFQMPVLKRTSSRRRSRSRSKDKERRRRSRSRSRDRKREDRGKERSQKRSHRSRSRSKSRDRHHKSSHRTSSRRDRSSDRHKSSNRRERESSKSKQDKTDGSLDKEKDSTAPAEDHVDQRNSTPPKDASQLPDAGEQSSGVGEDTDMIDSKVGAENNNEDIPAASKREDDNKEDPKKERSVRRSTRERSRSRNRDKDRERRRDTAKDRERSSRRERDDKKIESSRDRRKRDRSSERGREQDRKTSRDKREKRS